MIGTKGSSPATSSRFASEAVGRNGFSKRNHIQLRASPPRPVNWIKCTKQFLLGLLAVTSLLMLCTRLLLYFTFLSSRHGAMLEEQTSSDLLFKTEKYIMRSNGISGLAMDIETTRQIITDRNDAKFETAVDEGTIRSKVGRSPDGVAFLNELTLNLTAADVELENGPYHSRRVFEANYNEMRRKVKIFVYPHDKNDPYSNIYRAWQTVPTGNYASEAYFKQALMKSSFVTPDAAEADFFFMPVSITRARIDKRVGTEGVKQFCQKHVTAVRKDWSYWNRSGGVDHFYLSCHSIARTAMELVPEVRHNAIQLVCPSSYHLHYYITHKDASVPQIWPRDGNTPEGVKHIAQSIQKSWKLQEEASILRGSYKFTNTITASQGMGNDDEIFVHKGKVTFPYSEGLLTSKFCLHVKGYEVNTARLGDAMFYGCVPVVIADYYDLPFADILDWSKFAVVIPHLNIPLLKKTLKQITPAQYARMHQYVLQVRKHFQWHSPAMEFDAFYMVMYELWIRRHTVRNSLQ